MPPRPTIDSETALYCLLGDPVGHSLSPQMHNAAFRDLGVNAVYLAFRVAARDLKSSLRGLETLGMGGVNVTTPHKVEVIDHLDRLHDSVEDTGAVNTIVREDGLSIGYNTDVSGVEETLLASQLSVDGCDVLMFGNGGAARAVAAALSNLGSDRVTVIGRSRDRLERFASDVAKRTGVQVNSLTNSSEGLRSLVAQSNLLINATPVGMHPNTGQTVVPPRYIDEDATVFDLVYTPRKTTLLESAEQKGCRTIGGVDMLVEQGAASLELWLETEAPRHTMRLAVEEALEGT